MAIGLPSRRPCSRPGKHQKTRETGTPTASITGPGRWIYVCPRFKGPCLVIGQRKWLDKFAVRRSTLPEYGFCTASSVAYGALSCVAKTQQRVSPSITVGAGFGRSCLKRAKPLSRCNQHRVSRLLRTRVQQLVRPLQIASCTGMIRVKLKNVLVTLNCFIDLTHPAVHRP